VTYTGEFDVDFSMTLRARRSPTLLVMKDDTIDIEWNMNESGEIKRNQD
jgi:hypothetical protein